MPWLISFSLDLVRANTRFLILPVVAMLLISCAAPLRIFGTSTFGRTQDLSAADIDAAVAAYEASISHGPARYGDIEVVNHDEIRIYDDHAPCNYTGMIRKKGKWVIGSVVLVHSRY